MPARIGGGPAELSRVANVELNPNPVKWVLYGLGQIGQGIRRPLPPLAVACRETVVMALTAAGAAG